MAEGSLQEKGKQQEKAIKDKMPVRVGVFAQVSRVAKIQFIDVFQNVVLPIQIGKSIPRLTLVSLIDLMTEREVTPELLQELGIVKNLRDGIKILGNGDLTKKLTVKAHRFTQTAQEKIVASGGATEVI